METFPKFEKRGEEEQWQLEQIKERVILLCEQIKSKIDSGEYDAIVSDDSGGRIPTILFREIFRLVNPKHDFKTLFVASGQSYFPRNEKEENILINYLQRGLGDAKDILLVTEYIETGSSLIKLIEYLKKTGIENIDVSTIDIDKKSLSEKEVICSKIGCDNLYIGSTKNQPRIDLAANHNVLSGFSKNKEYNPIPIRLETVIESGERKRSEYLSRYEQELLLDIGEYDSDSEIEQAYLNKDEIFKKIDSIPLSSDEKIAIQENVRKTKLHIKELAGEIVSQVWEK